MSKRVYPYWLPFPSLTSVRRKRTSRSTLTGHDPLSVLRGSPKERRFLVFRKSRVPFLSFPNNGRSRVPTVRRTLFTLPFVFYGSTSKRWRPSPRLNNSFVKGLLFPPPRRIRTPTWSRSLCRDKGGESDHPRLIVCCGPLCNSYVVETWSLCVPRSSTL